MKTTSPARPPPRKEDLLGECDSMPAQKTLIDFFVCLFVAKNTRTPRGKPNFVTFRDEREDHAFLSFTKQEDTNIN